MIDPPNRAPAGGAAVRRGFVWVTPGKDSGRQARSSSSSQELRRDGLVAHRRRRRCEPRMIGEEIPAQMRPASSCRTRQFSRRSCRAASNTSEGFPLLSKCLENRPSLRAKSTKSTTFLLLGSVHQSSFIAGLPCRERRFLIVSPLLGS